MINKAAVLVSISIIIAGCVSAPKQLKETNSEIVIPAKFLENCKRPATVKESFVNIANKKATEKELVEAYMASHYNEVNCFSLKEEYIRLLTERNGNVN